jgi:FkbH-like protein
MSANLSLKWLPAIEAWEQKVKQVEAAADAVEKWRQLAELARYDLDLFQAAKLDRLLKKVRQAGGGESPFSRRTRIALIGTGTLDHLAGPIRIACLRRGIDAEVYVCAYNQVQTDLLDESSGLHSFKPDVVVFSIDARYARGLREGNVDHTVAALEGFWALARTRLRASVIQQTCLPIFPDVLGNNEHRLAEAPQPWIKALNRAMLAAGDAMGVVFLDADKHSGRDGLENWYDPQLWHRSKQEIHPRASLLYGDHVARLVAARSGISCKCMVLDLDNTLWGGVIGDDGLDGIKLGQGTPEGEAYTEFQQFVLQQRARGVILAVCSKNNLQTALEVFERHPDMLIRQKDVAAFSVSWDSKVEGLRKIAAELNIGVDSLLFVDDNPAERDLVRRSLPGVAVPELPADPAYYCDCLMRSGYLESISVTAEDAVRADQYQANQERARLQEASGDMQSYLTDLGMELEWGRVNQESFTRAVQLANKTNQFNMTTRRFTDAEVAAMAADPDWILLTARLKDKFGDNGIVALGFIHNEEGVGFIDTWVMSCRVFGRRLEDEMMNLFVAQLRAHPAAPASLKGWYKPTPKNSIVRDLYARLGFSMEQQDDSQGTLWSLDIANYSRRITQISVKEQQ